MASDPLPAPAPPPPEGRRWTRRDLGRASLVGLSGLAATQLIGCGAIDGRPAAAFGAAEAPDPAPAAPREWRAAWIASVANIDWPSQPGLPQALQRQEARGLLERAAALGLNALILQVRPAADALFASPLEPWSEYLGAAQGESPEPPWDPLEFWVDEAHRRGLALHAWFNPYRARHTSARSPLAAGHLARRRPDLVRTYGDQAWIDPGEADAAAHTLAVVADVARRYDIDGVHVDDYFYPYPVRNASGEVQPFPDEAPWQRYRRSGGRLARDDWRRDNVDRFVAALYREVHAIKPWLLVGISPFGIGKPALRPPGIEGFSQYDQLYADVERWCEEGWFDYLAPQLYWPMARRAQAFEVLCDYWLAQNRRQRHVWPGLFSSQVADGRPPWPADELLAQVAALRRRAAVGGHTHFSLSRLLGNPDRLASRLQTEAYAEPALVPASPWLDATTPGAPAIGRDGAGWQILPGPGQPVWRWAVWRRQAGHWRFSVQPATERRLDPAGAQRLVVSAVDRVGNEGPRVEWVPGNP